jgi:hypothetical protein
MCCLCFQNFMQMLDQARSNGALSPSTLAVMGRMCGLFGLGLMEAGVGDLLEGGWISGEVAARAIFVCLGMLA